VRRLNIGAKVRREQQFLATFSDSADDLARRLAERVARPDQRRAFLDLAATKA
jgi:hypothetical protein